MTERIQKLVAITNELKEKSEKNASAEENLKVLREKYNKAQEGYARELNGLRSDLENSSNMIDAISFEKEAKENELIAQIEEGKRAFENLSKDYEDLKAQHDQLQVLEKDNETQKTTALNEAIKRCDELLAQTNSLSKDILKLTEDNINLNKRIERQAFKLGDTLAKSASVEKENVNIKKQLETNKSEIENFKQKYQRLEKQCQDLTSENTKLLAKAATIKQEDIQEVTLNLNSLKSNNQTLKEMNESLMATNNEFKEEMETLKNKNHKMELKIKIGQDERDNLQKELDLIKVELKNKKDLESRIEDLENLVSDKDDDIRKLEEEMRKISLRDEAATTLKEEEVTFDVHETPEIKTLHRDIKILQAKLQKSREVNTTLAEEKAKLSEISESRVKEIVLEYEGKLTKMKEKMVSVYCDIL